MDEPYAIFPPRHRDPYEKTAKGGIWIGWGCRGDSVCDGASTAVQRRFFDQRMPVSPLITSEQRNLLLETLQPERLDLTRSRSRGTEWRDALELEIGSDKASTPRSGRLATSSTTPSIDKSDHLITRETRRFTLGQSNERPVQVR